MGYRELSTPDIMAMITLGIFFICMLLIDYIFNKPNFKPNYFPSWINEMVFEKPLEKGYTISYWRNAGGNDFFNVQNPDGNNILQVSFPFVKFYPFDGASLFEAYIALTGKLVTKPEIIMDVRPEILDVLRKSYSEYILKNK